MSELLTTLFLSPGRLQEDGVNVKYLPEHGPLSAWCKVQAQLAGVEF